MIFFICYLLITLYIFNLSKYNPLCTHRYFHSCLIEFVVGQVINVLRENNTVRVPGYRPQLVTHVRIPAVYKAGITLFAKKNTQVYTELMNAPELPIKPQSTHQTR